MFNVTYLGETVLCWVPLEDISAYGGKILSHYPFFLFPLEQGYDPGPCTCSISTLPMSYPQFSLPLSYWVISGYIRKIQRKICVRWINMACVELEGEVLHLPLLTIQLKSSGYSVPLGTEDPSMSLNAAGLFESLAHQVSCIPYPSLWSFQDDCSFERHQINWQSWDVHHLNDVHGQCMLSSCQGGLTTPNEPQMLSSEFLALSNMWLSSSLEA